MRLGLPFWALYRVIDICPGHYMGRRVANLVLISGTMQIRAYIGPDARPRPYISHRISISRISELPSWALYWAMITIIGLVSGRLTIMGLKSGIEFQP